MTYHWNMGALSEGLEEDALDDPLDRHVGHPEVRAHDHARDDDGHGAGDHLVAPRPLDLVELCPRLADEPAALAGLALGRLRLRRPLHACLRRPALARARRCG